MRLDRDGDPEELFEAVWSWHKEVYKKFSKFRFSGFGKGYTKALDSFCHDMNKNASGLRYALDKGTLPEAGRPSPHWRCYNQTYTNTRLMELILELARSQE